MELTFNYVLAFIVPHLIGLTALQHNGGNRILFTEDTFPGYKSFRTYEEIHPQLFYKRRKINTTLQKGKHIHSVTVYIQAFGRSFILDLNQNKNLFSPSYIEKRHHSLGVHKQTPNKDTHCFYHGVIRDKSESLVALSTCSGLYRGLISDDVNTYHIEESHGSHRIYRDTDKIPNIFKCGNDHHINHMTIIPKHGSTSDHIRRNKRSVIRGPYDGNDNTRFVELYLVNDQLTVLNHNSSEVIKRSQDIVNIVSRLYRPLNIYVALVGVEIWEDRNRVAITKNPDITLENFLRYRRERINPFHTNDNAQLITGTKFDEGVVGKAIKGRICTFQYSGGVNYDYDGLTTLATTVAHEMGHSFGMEHDNDSFCHCPESKCIMAATSGMTSPTKWSSCSKTSLQESFEIGMDYCLRNKPAKIYEGPVCGNGLVEEEETCDCGLPEDCTNRCCNATTCKLVPQARCGTGRCCNLDNCQFKEIATLCRSPIGECDLAEFCNGTSEYCPDNVYKQNGLICGSFQSYCYEGECNTHSSQCKLLWGTTGRASDPICYQQLNMQGTNDGNCGYNWTRSFYTRCQRENVMCGLLHCVHLNEKLMFWRDSLAHTMRASFLTRGTTQYVCRSAMLDVGIDMPDPGMVPNGAKCEEEKICVNHKCVPLAKLAIRDCSTNCANHGVCNSKGNCHCDIGYAPPLCDKPGYGGSIDSGKASNEYANTKLLVGLLAFFLLLLLAVIIFLAFFYRQRIRKLWKTMPEYSCRVPMKPIFQKSSNNKPKTSPTVVVDHRPVVSHPQNDASAPILSSSANRKSNVIISNPSQQKPLVSKQNQRPKSPVNKFKDRNHQRSQNQEKPEPKIPKFVPENKIFKPEPKVIHHASSVKSRDFTIQDVPLPPKPVISPKAEKKPLTEKISVPALSPKSEHIQKRESFRGADISHPVFVSTTNRNSNMFDDLPDTLPRGSHVSRSPSARGAPPVPPHGKNITVKRSKSDRSQGHRSPIRPSNLATQEEEEDPAKHKTLSKSVLDRVINPPKLVTTDNIPRSRSPSANVSFRSKSPPSRPLPPEPRVLPPKPQPIDDETNSPPSSAVYMNNPKTIFENDLLDDITMYLNTHSVESDDKPATYTNIPEGSKAVSATLDINKSKGNNPSHTNPVNKYSRDNKNSSVSKSKAIHSQKQNVKNDTKPSVSSNFTKTKGGLNSSTNPSDVKNKSDLQKHSVSPSPHPTSTAKPGDKSHISRINTKPATPPKTGASRTKSPSSQTTGVTRSASQVTALAAKFDQEKSPDMTSPSASKVVTPTRLLIKPKPPVKKIQSFNV